MLGEVGVGEGKIVGFISYACCTSVRAGQSSCVQCRPHRYCGSFHILSVGLYISFYTPRHCLPLV